VTGTGLPLNPHEGGESAGVTVLLDTNVLSELMRERPDAWCC
jgi:hypothetical protein